MIHTQPRIAISQVRTVHAFSRLLIKYLLSRRGGEAIKPGWFKDKNAYQVASAFRSDAVNLM
eukprot:6229691-Pyramimonas_sp.AAC.1